MTTPSLSDAKEAIYQSMDNNNDDIDEHITNLKAAMADSGDKQVEFAPERLAQNNRQGRKHMQSYFKKRGIKVVFAG